MPCPEVQNTAASNRSWRRKKKKASPAGPAPTRPAPPPPGLQVREVWAENVEREFKLIRAAIDHFPYVSLDTEFPGVIHLPGKHPGALTAGERYALVKANVDALHLIQVGLTFAATPSSPPALCFQINLCDFDPRAHRHAPESLALLAASGVDLAASRARGVPASTLAALMMSSGLVCNHHHHHHHHGGAGGVTWVAFGSGYDFAYLIKLLMGRKLPASMADFLRYVRVFFGDDVYDVKHVMRHCDGLYGGLDRVAATLGVRRAAGRSHQAGSDSVLTWDTFRRIRQLYFAGNPKQVHSLAGVIFGLELADAPQARPQAAASHGVRVHAHAPCIASVV